MSGTVLSIVDSVRLVLRARAEAILDPLDRAVYAIAGPLQLAEQTFAVAGGAGRFHRAGAPGVWYACAALPTAAAEIAFHQRRRVLASGLGRLAVRLIEARAAFAGAFLDQRAIAPESPASRALSEDMTVGWPAGQALADEARAQRLDGIVWSSVRDPARGDAYAVLERAGVRAPRWGEAWRPTVDAGSAAVPSLAPDAPLIAPPA